MLDLPDSIKLLVTGQVYSNGDLSRELSSEFDISRQEINRGVNMAQDASTETKQSGMQVFERLLR
jgi:hypothetical protein